MSRHSRFAPAAIICAALIGAGASNATAQEPVPDTAAADTLGPRPEFRPPISPRRAFLYSLAIPGYAQSILGRGRAGTLEIAFEAVALIMIRQSATNLREAKRNFVADSVPVSFVNETGGAGVTRDRTPFPATLIRSRRAQLEDWIAVLIANHLFSAADGYVAALLWDLPVEIGVSGAPDARHDSRGASIALNLAW